MSKPWYETYPEDWWFGKDHVTPEHVRFIVRALRLRRGQEVLDAPCGDGQLGLQLARRGIHITGVDRNKKFTRRARQRFRREGLEGRFFTRDLRQIDFSGSFNAICCWYNSFGYFEEEENEEVLMRFARCLKPGGRLLIDHYNRPVFLRHVRKNSKRESEWWVESGTWNPKTQQHTYTLTQKATGKTATSVVRNYSMGQFKALFQRAGLEIEVVFGSKRGEPYRRNSRAMIVVGRKPR